MYLLLQFYFLISTFWDILDLLSLIDSDNAYSLKIAKSDFLPSLASMFGILDVWLGSSVIRDELSSIEKLLLCVF